MEARRCVALARERLEDTTVGVKYLSNVLKHPADDKYRKLKISNRSLSLSLYIHNLHTHIYMSSCRALY